MSETRSSVFWMSAMAPSAVSANPNELVARLVSWKAVAFFGRKTIRSGLAAPTHNVPARSTNSLGRLVGEVPARAPAASAGLRGARRRRSRRPRHDRRDRAQRRRRRPTGMPSAWVGSGRCGHPRRGSWRCRDRSQSRGLRRGRRGAWRSRSREAGRSRAESVRTGRRRSGRGRRWSRPRESRRWSAPCPGPRRSGHPSRSMRCGATGRGADAW